VTDQSTRDPGRDGATSSRAEAERGASPREEAERLVAASLGAVATALHGIEARRQLRLLAEQVFGADRLDDLTAGLNGYVSGVGPDGAGTAGAAAGVDGAAGAGAVGAGAMGAGATSGGGMGFATGSANCCICPVCRVIAALRDPSPEFAERMASSVGDLAVGLTGLLRSLGTVLGTPDRHDSWAAATADPSRPAPGGGS
jgi:hypothetical protein